MSIVEYIKRILKSVKKNEIIIYTISLMLVAAGYFNYKQNVEDLYVQTASEAETNEYSNIGDAQLVSNNDVEQNNKEQKEEKKEESKEKEQKEESTKEVANEEPKTDENKDDYFVSSKLERDKNYASMISSYTKILEDNNVSETEKSTAMKEITKINNNKNTVSVCENLISTKGFKNCIVFINDESVNVVVEDKEKLSKDKVAQIQNIISREVKCGIENIHITQKST